MTDSNSSFNASNQDTIVLKVLELLENHLWSDLSLIQIAKASHLSGAQLYNHFMDKGEILKAIMHLMNKKTLEIYATGDQLDVDVDPIDALFEIIMCRLDVLTPYKKSFKNLTCSLWGTPFNTFEALPEFFNSLEWMLEMSSISTKGILGMIKVKAFAIVYGIIFKEWLSQENSDPSNMMVTIDKLLKQMAPLLKKY